MASKADATYPIVGGASIVAKVSRDKLVHGWNHMEVRESCLKRKALEPLIDNSLRDWKSLMSKIC